jgi:hypothetical protein
MRSRGLSSPVRGHPVLVLAKPLAKPQLGRCHRARQAGPTERERPPCGRPLATTSTGPLTARLGARSGPLGIWSVQGCAGAVGRRRSDHGETPMQDRRSPVGPQAQPRGRRAVPRVRTLPEAEGHHHARPGVDRLGLNVRCPVSLGLPRWARLERETSYLPLSLLAARPRSARCGSSLKEWARSRAVRPCV